ncbi:hypothetical protein F2B00_17950 [Streptomyces parvus]|uniref:hypothetical protein n=1 Tax=Streptomyces TaxID=1883 RepID=UPI000D5181E3|nr:MULTISPECIES: hypothetical protein [Streptomyces]KAA6200886.1 hypothetical protein F2B00_17950 [Streptomyces parvus]PVC80882.1 hypothetical protein DBP20_23795 [Streptomyces sp. CS131]GGS11435.1 hypothetical protein GCM10010221_04620 [Streptomyces parvus]
MDQCTAVTLLPPPDFVLRLAAADGGSRPEAGHLLCELAPHLFSDRERQVFCPGRLWTGDAGLGRGILNR